MKKKPRSKKSLIAVLPIWHTMLLPDLLPLRLFSFLPAPFFYSASTWC